MHLKISKLNFFSLVSSKITDNSTLKSKTQVYAEECTTDQHKSDCIQWKYHNEMHQLSDFNENLCSLACVRCCPFQYPILCFILEKTVYIYVKTTILNENVQLALLTLHSYRNITFCSRFLLVLVLFLNYSYRKFAKAKEEHTGFVV